MPELNKENVQKLINFLNSEQINFDMRIWKDSEKAYENLGKYGDIEQSKCGTICCIGGTADVIQLFEMYGPNANLLENFLEDFSGAKWLGMTDEDYEAMCYPPFHMYETIERADAIRYLERILAGESDIDWYDVMGVEESADDEDQEEVPTYTF